MAKARAVASLAVSNVAMSGWRPTRVGLLMCHVTACAHGAPHVCLSLYFPPPDVGWCLFDGHVMCLIGICVCVCMCLGKKCVDARGHAVLRLRGQPCPYVVVGIISTEIAGKAGVIKLRVQPARVCTTLGAPAPPLCTGSFGAGGGRYWLKPRWQWSKHSAACV